MPLLVVVLLGLLFVGWTVSQPWRVERRRERLRRRPFPAAWRRILKRRVPIFRRLPTDLQLQLKGHIQVFLAEKPFIGCAGQRITDEVRVSIAAQACLLLLNRPRPRYFEALRQVLVYPGAFIVDRAVPAGAGVLQDQRRALAGESWQAGQVILSWQDVLEGAGVEDDGRNVVLHEFAHQLDQETGEANGAPRLSHPRQYRGWSRVFGDAFARLGRDLDREQPTLLGPYAASSPAEFFAVATEIFFERPNALATDSPELYGELAQFYRTDPRNW